MTSLANDRPQASGLALAVLSAASFGTSGALARGLLTSGWSPIAVVTVRLGLGSLILAPLAARQLHGRWRALGRRLPLIVAYGTLAMALAQLGYFSAVQRMAVAPSLLIEYTSPATVIVWLWVTRGERPTLVTGVGGAVVIMGLVLVLNLLGGARVSAVGVVWALVAMAGAAGYFLMASAGDAELDVPPLALSAGGLVVGTVLLGAVGATGILPVHVSTAPARYAGTSVPWWVPLLALGAISTAVPYCAGIAGIRRLGSRIAAFVGLLEVVAGVGFAWLLLAQTPSPIQAVGGLIIIAGIVIVRAGERAPAGVAGELAQTLID